MADSPMVCYDGFVPAPPTCSSASSKLLGTSLEIVCRQKQQLVFAIRNLPCINTITSSGYVITVSFQDGHHGGSWASWAAWPCLAKTSAGWGYLRSNLLLTSINIIEAHRVPIPFTLVYSGDCTSVPRLLDRKHHFLGETSVVVYAETLPGIGVIDSTHGWEAAIPVCISGSEAYLTFDDAAPPSLLKPFSSVEAALSTYWKLFLEPFLGSRFTTSVGYFDVVSGVQIKHRIDAVHGMCTCGSSCYMWNCYHLTAESLLSSCPASRLQYIKGDPTRKLAVAPTHFETEDVPRIRLHSKHGGWVVDPAGARVLSSSCSNENGRICVVRVEIDQALLGSPVAEIGKLSATAQTQYETLPACISLINGAKLKKNIASLARALARAAKAKKRKTKASKKICQRRRRTVADVKETLAKTKLSFSITLDPTTFQKISNKGLFYWIRILFTVDTTTKFLFVPIVDTCTMLDPRANIRFGPHQIDQLVAVSSADESAKSLVGLAVGAGIFEVPNTGESQMCLLINPMLVKACTTVFTLHGNEVMQWLHLSMSMGTQEQPWDVQSWLDNANAGHDDPWRNAWYDKSFFRTEIANYRQKIQLRIKSFQNYCHEQDRVSFVGTLVHDAMTAKEQQRTRPIAPPSATRHRQLSHASTY